MAQINHVLVDMLIDFISVQYNDICPRWNDAYFKTLHNPNTDKEIFSKVTKIFDDVDDELNEANALMKAMTEIKKKLVLQI